MSQSPSFLTTENIIEINRRRVAETGEVHQVRDRNLLESAVAEPRQTFDGEYLHQDLFSMAAAYAFSLAKNHPFEQGNKRTALEATTTFLILNGYKPIEIYEGQHADWIFAIVEGKTDQEAFAEYLSNCAVPLSEDGSEES